MHEARGGGPRMAGRRDAVEEDLEPLKPARVAIPLHGRSRPQDGERVEAAKDDAVCRVEGAEDRDEPVERSGGIRVGKRLRQPRQATRLCEVVVYRLDQRVTGPEAVVDREAGKARIARDGVERERIAADEHLARGREDASPCGVDAGETPLHPIGARAHTCILAYIVYAGIMERYDDLEGKVAVVTGGSRGIGAATARALALSGALVAVVGRDPVAIGTTVESIITTGGRAMGVAADCTRESDIAELRRSVEEQLGPVGILATFAGGSGMPVPSERETGEHWRLVLESDLTSTFLTISEFLPGMIERHAGAIVTMSSAAARQAAKSSAAYAAAKAGVIAFTRHLAGEFAKDGIRVNCLAPSAVENDRMRAWMSAEDRSALGAAFPLGRIGQPDDVAAAALFLASPASSWITGVVIDIAGGKVMV